MASSRFVWHISSEARRLLHTLGRWIDPKMLHKLSSDNCTHLTFAGLPFGIPGIGLDIEGAMQHAPQSLRHSIRNAPDIADEFHTTLTVEHSNR